MCYSNFADVSLKFLRLCRAILLRKTAGEFDMIIKNLAVLFVMILCVGCSESELSQDYPEWQYNANAQTPSTELDSGTVVVAHQTPANNYGNSNVQYFRYHEGTLSIGSRRGDESEDLDCTNPTHISRQEFAVSLHVPVFAGYEGRGYGDNSKSSLNEDDGCFSHFTFDVPVGQYVVTWKEIDDVQGARITNTYWIHIIDGKINVTYTGPNVYTTESSRFFSLTFGSRIPGGDGCTLELTDESTGEVVYAKSYESTSLGANGIRVCNFRLDKKNIYSDSTYKVLMYVHTVDEAGDRLLNQQYVGEVIVSTI